MQLKYEMNTRLNISFKNCEESVSDDQDRTEKQQVLKMTLEGTDDQLHFPEKIEFSFSLK